MNKVTTTLRRGLVRIAAIDFVRTAIEEKADLREFKEKPSLQVVAGVFLISISFVLAWPAITALGIVAIKLKEPLIVVIGGPLAYGLSHLVFLAGMYFSGAKYTVIFFRWLSRILVEKLLSWIPVESQE
ncbi:MAG: hypothetical protein K0A99_04975 [Desulfoarculaceae bacterium]|nr:hypothetical protein [Desulfoarculaceae bacterium]